MNLKADSAYFKYLRGEISVAEYSEAIRKQRRREFDAMKVAVENLAPKPLGIPVQVIAAAWSSAPRVSDIAKLKPTETSRDAD